MKKNFEWKIRSIGPQTSTEVEEVDDDEYEGAIVRTVREKAIIGIPVENESLDSAEIDKLLDNFAQKGSEEELTESIENDESRKSSSVPSSLLSDFEMHFKQERDEALREIRSRVTKEVGHFESARQKLHELLHRPSDKEKTADEKQKSDEKQELQTVSICARCKEVDLEALIEDNAELRRKLAQFQKDHEEERFECKCQMKNKVDKMKREENALLETIALKMERLEALKLQDHEADLLIEQTKIKLCERLAETKKINNLLTAADDAFKFKCKQIQEYEVENKRSDEKVKKLREEARVSTNRLAEAEKRVKGLHSQLTKLQNECRLKEEAVLKERSTIVQLDDSAVKLRSEIKNLKDELQMLAESLKFHRREVDERHKEAHALILDEKQAEKQLEAQRRASDAQKQAVATEVERTKTLELVAHNYLQEAETLSQALRKLRASKTNVESELEELKLQITCKESEMESELDRLETLKATVKNLRDERHSAGETLLTQVRRERAKIRTLLDDIETLGVLLCEAVYIKLLIARDNKQLEKGIPEGAQQQRSSVTQEQDVFDLEDKIDKHKQLIAAIGVKMDAFEAAHQNSGDDDEVDKVVKLTYRRLTTLGENPNE